MADLAELLERVKAATGPDRELDGKIEVAIRWEEAARVGLKPEHRAKWRSNRWGAVGDGHTEYDAERFTASLDAALALVERVLPEVGVSLHIENSRGLYGAVATLIEPPTKWGQSQHEEFGKTASLALLAALLSALIAQPASGDVGSAKLKENEP